MDTNRPIGLFDSGLGGLSVVREVFKQLPHESVLYFGDTARVPYGPREASEILAFNREIVDWLLQAGSKLILVACNTSSALALTELARSCPVPILGVIAPGAEAASVGSDIGVIATEGTVRSGAYERAIHAHNPQARVRQVACPGLVPLIESGDWEGPEAEGIVKGELACFLATPPDVLVLGCTHYPHLAPMIQRLLGASVTLVDPAARAVAKAAELLGAQGLLADGTPRHRFAVSGEAQPFFETAKRLLPGMMEHVEKVTLPSLELTQGAR